MASRPHAIALVNNCRSFLLLYALFALADPGMTSMYFLFATLFINMMQYIEDEWLPVVVGCIKKGIIPDLENVEYARPALEVSLSYTAYVMFGSIFIEILRPKPFSCCGTSSHWSPSAKANRAVHVWPALRTFVSITGGIAAAVVPKAYHPGIIYSSAYAIGLPYDKSDPVTSHKILIMDELIKFLEVSSDETLQSWELAAGRHYEPILTTRDGLWSYRIHDIIIVKGFAPEDGLPVVNYVGRQDGQIKHSYGTSTESGLTSAILSAAELYIGQVIEFVIVIDERDLPLTFGYILEISGEIGIDAHMVPQYALEDHMASNEKYRIGIGAGNARKPKYCDISGEGSGGSLPPAIQRMVIGEGYNRTALL
ncbi:hypothetical protein K503DRAFT_863378 [Rhizopogon vinicolor AM-OR11-026]|uniref:GH3 middle domain-containing protein n=1 Tax=Rhizopogon vinicolor AM-OR11-026 TaxID=1314800 RepID=A0A1B7NB25_9AGAM|nr:hypothetical protein K503DRAFT_863378 [Rhizopogon vinicolor AM-OR11-026]